MKKIMLISLGLCFMMSVSNAQGPKHHGPHHHKHHPKLGPEAKAELDALQKEKVYPVKKAAHDKFLAALSAADRTFLDEKRAEGMALHKEMRALHREMRGAKESGKSREDMHAERKAKFGPMHEKQKAFMESMKPFMERNQGLVKEAMESMKPMHEDVRAEKKAIFDKYASEEQKAKMEMHRKKKEGKQESHPERMEKHKEHHKAMHAVKFVLWDGEMKTHEPHKGRKDCKGKGKDCPKEGKKGGSKNAKTGDAAFELNNSSAVAMNLNNYPNPAMTQTTIMFELKSATKKAKVVIVDAQGKEMWKKNYNKLDAGEHKLDVDLRKFTNGQYFYTLEVDGEQMTKTLVVNK